MVTCQLSELGWEVTVELPADFLSLGRGSVKHLLNLHEPMVCHHRIFSPCECRRMMRPKPLEVTRTSLTTRYTSLCYSCCCNTNGLYKGLLIKYWWLVKCRWCLTSTPWTPSTSSSSSSTSHLHCLNGKLNTMQYP